MFGFQSISGHLKSLVQDTSSLDQLKVKCSLPYETQIEALVQLKKILKAINYLDQCTKKGDKTEITVDTFVVRKIKHTEVDNHMHTCFREAGATITGSELL